MPMNKPTSRSRARYHSIPSIRHGHLPPPTGKDILVFCDGTGKDGSLAKDPTNIWRLYELTTQQETAISGGRQREIVYIPGVGAGPTNNPANILSRIFGTTIVDMIVTAYLHIAKHYNGGDRIHLFGYSRGAFVARKVASLIYRIGIVRTEKELLELWSQRENPVPWVQLDLAPRGTIIPIKSLVVWDTVGAIHSLPTRTKMEADILGMSDEEVPPNVKHAFHVVAFHENRRLFRVTLFKPESREDSERLKEVWFPGAHADVGGGGSNKISMPNISLVWVLGELQATCSLTVSHAQLVELDYPDLHDLAPSDAYHESPPWKRAVDKCETRLPLLKPTTLVHETVIYRRNLISTALDPRSKFESYMLTADDLGKVGWDIKTYLVARSTLETLKQKQAHAQRKLKEQAAQYRSLITSVHIQPTMNSTNQYQNTPEFIPRSRRPSVALQTRLEPAVSPPPATVPPLAHRRSRAESHVIPRSRDTRFEQTAPRPAPAVAPLDEKTGALQGTASSRRPSAPLHPSTPTRPTSTRSRAESYAAPPTRPTPPGQATSDWVFVEPARPRKVAVSSTSLASSRPGPSIPPYPPTHVSPTSTRSSSSTRSRTESQAGPRPPPVPPKQDDWTLVEVPEHDRAAKSPADVPSPSDIFEPRPQTTLVRTASIRSRTESLASRRLRSTSPVEAVPIPGTGSRLPTIPSKQVIHHSAPTEVPQRGRNALSLTGVTPRPDFPQPRSPTALVRTASIRSRAESHASPRLRSTSLVGAVPAPSPMPMGAAVPRYGRNVTPSASPPPSRGITTRNLNLPTLSEEDGRTSEQRVQSYNKDGQHRSERWKA